MGYSIIAPFQSPEKATVAAIYAALRERFHRDNSVDVSLQTDPAFDTRHVQLKSGDWSLRVYSDFKPHVLQESKEIAEFYGAGRSDQAAIASCAYRITVASDDDPDMNYFNEYMFVLEVLQELGAVALFDPLSESFALE